MLVPYSSRGDVWLWPCSKQPSYMKKVVVKTDHKVNTVHSFMCHSWNIKSWYLCSSCCDSLPMEAQIGRMKTDRETPKLVWWYNTPQCTKQPLGFRNLCLQMDRDIRHIVTPWINTIHFCRWKATKTDFQNYTDSRFKHHVQIWTVKYIKNIYQHYRFIHIKI